MTAKPVVADEKKMGEAPAQARGSAPELLRDAIANVKANAGDKGLTPQQKRAIEKIQSAIQMLTGTQTKYKPPRQKGD